MDYRPVNPLSYVLFIAGGAAMAISIEFAALPKACGADANTSVYVQQHERKLDEIQKTLKDHTQVLHAMDNYFSKLQAKGVVPRPEALENMTEYPKR